MLLYRGLKDIFPSKVDSSPRDGMYGIGVYLSKRQDVAWWYSFKACDIFGIIIIYNCSARIMSFIEGEHFKADHPTSEHFNLTKDGQNLLGVKSKIIQKVDLLELSAQRGFNGVQVNLHNFCEQAVVLRDYDNIEIDEILFQSYSDEKMISGLTERKMKSVVRKLKKELDSIEEAS